MLGDLLSKNESVLSVDRVMRHLVIQIIVIAWLQASSHGYCSTVARQLIRHCLLVIFWPITTSYSADVASCIFFLYPKLKGPMKGRRFATIEEIKTASL